MISIHRQSFHITYQQIQRLSISRPVFKIFLYSPRPLFPNIRLQIFFIHMQEVKDHFVLQETSIIEGVCTEFISEKEKLWRSIEKYEEYPYQRVAAHARNIQYVPLNTRTFETLKRVLAYLMKTVFPIFFDKEVNRKEKERVAIFLEERLIAIRCEYFVQGIVCPSELLKLLRCFIVVNMMKGLSTGTSPLIGLELLVQAESKEIMSKSFPKEYLEALKYFIIGSQKKELTKLLYNHPIIFEEEELSRLLLLKIRIDSNNFFTFYRALEEESPIIRCLLWQKMEEIKNLFAIIVKKSFGDVPKEWLFRRLGLKSPSQPGWVNLKQNQEILQCPEFQLHYNEWIEWIDVQTIKVLVA